MVSTKYSFPGAAELYIVCAAEEADRIIIKKAGSKINLLLMCIKNMFFLRLFLDLLFKSLNAIFHYLFPLPKNDAALSPFVTIKIQGGKNNGIPAGKFPG
jgi:hypothetical protein